MNSLLSQFNNICIPRIEEAVQEQVVKKAAFQSKSIVENRALNTPPGRPYLSRKTGKFVQGSQVGNPSGIDSGELVKSFRFRVAHYTIIMSFTAKYASIQEYTLNRDNLAGATEAVKLLAQKYIAQIDLIL